MDPVDWAKQYAQMIMRRWGGICRIDDACREAAVNGAEGDYFVETGEPAPSGLSAMVRDFYAQAEPTVSKGGNPWRH